MLSPFLKKLLFVRQFFMTDGKIEILGETQILLPIEALSMIDNPKVFAAMSKQMKSSMQNYAKKIGTSPDGMIKSVQEIYETMGLGKMQVIKLDQEKKSCTLRIKSVKTKNTNVIAGIIGGLFSFLFKKNLTQKDVNVRKKSGFLEVSLK